MHQGKIITVVILGAKVAWGGPLEFVQPCLMFILSTQHREKFVPNGVRDTYLIRLIFQDVHIILKHERKNERPTMCSPCQTAIIKLKYFTIYTPTHHLKLCRAEMWSRMWVDANLLLAHVNNLNCPGSGRLKAFFLRRSDQCAIWRFSQQNTIQSS